MYVTKDVPLFDYHNAAHYLQCFTNLFGKKRAEDAIDLFIFSNNYPFENIKEVVVGRYWIDSAIIEYSHLHSMPVVDISNLHSFHQGMDRSGYYRKFQSANDFYYNRDIMGSFNRNDTYLTSSHYVL